MQGCSRVLQRPGEDHPEEVPGVRIRIARSPSPLPSLPQKKDDCSVVILSSVVHVNPASMILFSSTVRTVRLGVRT